MQAVALVGLFLIGIFYTLYFASAVFIPVALALLLKLVLAPVVRRLTGIGIPETLGSGLVIALLLAAVGTGILSLSEPASEWLAQAPRSFEMAEYKLKDLKQSVEEVSKATKKVEEIAGVSNDPAVSRAVVVQGPGLAESVVSGASSVLGAVVITTVLLFFLLASGDLFLRKLVKVLPSLHDKRRAIEIARQTERDISTYLFTVTIVNALLGSATALTMWLLEMPNPVLWGVLAAVLNFIPYVGPGMMILILALVSLLTFNSWPQILLPPGVYLGLTFLEGQLLTPLTLSHRLTLNPVVIFVALLVWGWLWSVPGLLLAVPLLAAFKIVCDRVEPLRPIGHFLAKRDE
jgi:predicted PurR-regulated permease PerM